MPRLSWSRAGAFLYALAVVSAVAFADGGYFRDTWAWIAVAFSCAAAIALLLRERVAVGRLELLALGALTLFVGWTALSGVWSSDPTASLHEAERTLAYVAALLAILVLVERDDVRALLAGVAAGIAIVGTYGLGTRLFGEEPLERDPVSGTRLIEPLGYANALGILAVVGILLSLGFAVHGANRLVRALGSAASTLLLSTLALTESRASWLALVLGLGAWALLETRRARLLATGFVLTLPALAVVWLSGRSAAFALLAIASALATFLVPPVELRLAEQLRWAVRVLPAVALVVVTLGAVLGTNRSLEARTDYWRVAWGQFEDNAVLGSGAGTFAEYWLRSGIPAGVRDAHSVYLETLAEIGPLGLAMLLVALGVPLYTALQVRTATFVGVAFGAYVAYLVHAGLDWDWEMPAVTLAALFCGGGLLVSARAHGAAILGTRARGVVLLAAFGLAATAIVARLLSG